MFSDSNVSNVSSEKSLKKNQEYMGVYNLFIFQDDVVYRHHQRLEKNKRSKNKKIQKWARFHTTIDTK